MQCLSLLLRFVSFSNAAPLLCGVALAGSQGNGRTPPASTPETAHYHVLRTFQIGGEGGWDYLAVEPTSRRLFVTRSTHVMVIDADNGKQVGDVPDTAGVHGVALVPALGRGFTSNGKANTSTIFDLKTLAAIATVKTGENPDAILYEPTSKRVFTFNGHSKDATAIDAATGAVLGTVALGGKPEAGVTDGTGRIFVNLEDTSEIATFDATELKVTVRWPLAPAEEPSGLALDAKNHCLFSACGNQMLAVLDSASGKVLKTLPIGKGVDGAAFDSASGCAFSSNGDGTLTVVHGSDPSNFSVLESVPTARGARTIALDPTTHHLYLPTAKYEAAPEPKPGEKPARPKMIEGSFMILEVGADTPQAH